MCSYSFCRCTTRINVLYIDTRSEKNVYTSRCVLSYHIYTYICDDNLITDVLRGTVVLLQIQARGDVRYKPHFTLSYIHRSSFDCGLFNRSLTLSITY